MKRDGKRFHRLTATHGSNRLHLLFGAFAVALGLQSVACSGDVNDQRPPSGSSGSAGAGGMDGVGAMAGQGGAGGSINPPEVEYSANNLFTHVPRFMIFKRDYVRNICIRIGVEGLVGGGQYTIDVTMPWAVGNVEVTPDLNDCVLSGGFPTTPATSYSALSGTGTILVEGSFPCSTSVHANFTFDPVETWVPAMESFDVDALPVDGGCG